jgi:uncharacterized protein YdbL (DUF1318 family)
MNRKTVLGVLALIVAAVLPLANAFAEDTADANATVAKEWRSYVEPMLSIGEHVAPLIADINDPQQRNEMYQQIFKTTSMAYFAMFLGDPQHPDFWPLFNQAYSIGSANPDDAYYLAPLDGKGVYKISGYRGSVRLIDFQIGSGGFYPYGKGPMAPTFANYDADDLQVDKKTGEFSVILSSERPQGYKGDWWRIDPRTTYVMVRQIAYDWLQEVDGRFGIERLDTPPIKPRLSAEEIDANLHQIAVAAEQWIRLPTGRLVSYIGDGLINKVAVRDLSKSGGFTTKQFYVEGLIDIKADEALIYETTVPKKCRYWNIVTNDNLWNAVDYTNRQTNLNGYTARIDKDGKFRAVISSADPGVPNWLDTAGYSRGSLFGRWLQCDSTPTPTITKVKFADIRKYLPADTPVVSAEARDTSLRLRRHGAQLRKRW